MSRNTKRKFEDFDPNKSDSDDGDYENAAPSSAKKRRSKPSQPKSAGRKPPKRKRERLGDSDDDLDDDDITSEEDEASFSEDSEAEAVPVNPKTGRRQRSAAKKNITYQESSDGDDDDDDGDEVPGTPSGDDEIKPPTRAQKSHIVVLRISPSKMRSTAATGWSTRRGSRRESASATTGADARRSSRISRHSEEPLVELSDSGKHTQVAGAGSPEPLDDLATRRVHGGKGVKSISSGIIEVSQEASETIQPGDEVEPSSIVEQLIAHAGGDGDEEMELVAEMDDDDGDDAAGQREPQDNDGNEAEDDDDDEPVLRRASRTLRSRPMSDSPPPPTPAPARRSLRPRKATAEQSSDFEPDGDEEEADENVSEDESPAKKKRGASDSDGAATNRSGRLPRKGKASQRPSAQSESGHSELDLDEIADEAAELDDDRRRNKRPRRGRQVVAGVSYEPNLRNRSNRPDYRLFRPEILLQQDEEENAPAPSASQGRGRKANAPYRSLFSTLGPFGGAGGPAPVFGGPAGHNAATGGVDSDSSDDDAIRRPSAAFGATGMTPGMAQTPFGLAAQTHNNDANAGGGPANFGRVKDRKALADADPLGVSAEVNFDQVGGLGDHIDRLKEMVALPLLYPEVFQRFSITPPRGVLFHGPPGTGKTLLARALASSISTNGQKVTFYMRKGADALSKWVGEAEKQLRLLFEEARKTQPSIIFFDEIDGLAPVRSSKQEQIHASIVATLLALMDGMDGRGQVIVIGATNRPDSVDPALRRPGRFDREFYFPLPDKSARREIIDIHTKGWQSPLAPQFKDQLADLTKGYGGADLRALCTEATLNAVQGTFPQIYATSKKLLIDPSQIKVLAKDFMISVNKIVPSSERSATSGSVPLKKELAPLLRDSIEEIKTILKDVIPNSKKRTALEEAQYDDREDEFGFEKETLQRDFEAARVFRPRLLIYGMRGMGQQYVGAALLNSFDRMYVANFDLANIYKDTSRTPEAAIVQMFEEVKRHKPSVIYIPNVDIWYQSLTPSAIKTFTGLLRSLPPTDPVLLLGIMENHSKDEIVDKAMTRDLFAYSSKNMYLLNRPDEAARREYFQPIIDHIRRSPAQFPEKEERKKRVLPVLPEAPQPPPPPKAGPNKAQLKAQKRHDHYWMNVLKQRLQLIMDQIKLKYRKFRLPPIDERQFQYLFDEQDPEMMGTDLPEEEAGQHMHRPYRVAQDKKGVAGLLEVATGKFYYNMEIVTIELRLANGYYKRPKDFLADIKKLAKDSTTLGDQERMLKASELYTNVSTDVFDLEASVPNLAAECEGLFQREQARESEQRKKLGQAPAAIASAFTSTDASSGPIRPVVEFAAPRSVPPFTPVKSNLSNGFHHDEEQPDSKNGEDVEMTDSHDAAGEPHTDTQQQHRFETPRQDTQMSQHSSVMQMAPGTLPRDYHNSASTTTSGEKTGDRSSDRTGNTQHTSSSGEVNFGLDPHGGHELPATQTNGEMFSQVSPQSSPEALRPRPMGPPEVPHHAQSGAAQSSPNHDAGRSARRMSDIDLLLNHDQGERSTVPATTANPSLRPPVLIEAHRSVLEPLAANIVSRSSGLSVEQLEQVNAALMRAIWETRSQWNRNKVASLVGQTFNETIVDLESVQEIMKPSQMDEDGIPAGSLGLGTGWEGK